MENDHDGDRTHNLPIRSRTPYPLGHAVLPYLCYILTSIPILSRKENPKYSILLAFWKERVGVHEVFFRAIAAQKQFINKLNIKYVRNMT